MWKWKIINSKVHGFLDYSVSLFVMMMPWLFHFSNGGLETYIPVIAGFFSIAYSLITDYEWGLIRVLKLRTHLVLDLISGLFLAASPWIFNFHDEVYLPHLIIGLMEIMVVLISDTVCCGKTPRTVSMRRFSGKDSPEVL
jgi:hypothetical protein